MNVLRPLVSLGLRRGLVGGSRLWLGLGAVAGVLRLAGRLWRREPVVETLELRPGEVVEVRHLHARHDQV